jgi:hypothetical protein
LEERIRREAKFWWRRKFFQVRLRWAILLPCEDEFLMLLLQERPGNSFGSFENLEIEEGGFCGRPGKHAI